MDAVRTGASAGRPIHSGADRPSRWRLRSTHASRFPVAARFAPDSPLEGGVYCELVSEVGFPVLAKKQGFRGFMDDNGSVETLFWARIR